MQSSTRRLERELTPAMLVLVAAGLAALWPLSAYVAGPFAFPAAAAATGAALIVIRRPEFGLALALAVTPWTNLVVGRSKPFHLVIPVIAFALLVYSLLLARPARLASHERRLMAAVLGFLVAGLIASLGALRPGASETKLVVLASATALFVATLTICRERRQLIVVIGGAIAGLALAGAQGIVEQLSGSYATYGLVGAGGLVGRVQGSFGHPNTYGGYLAVLIPLALVVALSRECPRRLRWMAAAATALALPALQFSYSRGAILGLALGLLLWLALLRPAYAVVGAVAAAVLIGLLAPSALRERFQQQGRTTGEVALRQDVWGAALDIYSEHPATGVGLNNFPVAYARLPATPANASQRRLLHGYNLITPPHAQSQYLNILAEEGILGALAFLVLSMVALRVSYLAARLPDRLGRALGYGLGAGLVALAVQGFLDANLIGEIAFPVFALLAVAGVFVRLDRGGSPSAAQAGAAPV